VFGDESQRRKGGVIVALSVILFLEDTANSPEPAIDATAEVEADVPELTP
jgi:hypothetical protein